MSSSHVLSSDTSFRTILFSSFGLILPDEFPFASPMTQSVREGDESVHFVHYHSLRATFEGTQPTFSIRLHSIRSHTNILGRIVPSFRYGASIKQNYVRQAAAGRKEVFDVCVH